MGIVSWARTRFNGKTECRGFDLAAGKESRRQVVPEEEIKHLTNNEQQRFLLHQQEYQASLLSIGTFGSTEHPDEDDDDLPELTMEEAKKLQYALAKLLRRARSKHSARGFDAAGAESTSGLPLDRFLNCPSSLEVDRRNHRNGEDGDLSPSTKIILSMAKDLLVNSSGNASIKNKSFKFMLKKMFVCGSDGNLATLKVPTENIMDKFFRAVLGKTVNFRRPTNGSAFLEPDRSKEMPKGGQSRREEEEGNSCRWDRTDSQFIVLEI